MSKDEYENTLVEFQDILAVAESFLESKISVLNLSHFNEEIDRQRKFYTNLSHCMQVLESLEDNFSPTIKKQYTKVHDDLKKKSNIVLDRCAHHMVSLDNAYSDWSEINKNVALLKTDQEALTIRMSNQKPCTTENYKEI